MRRCHHGILNLLRMSKGTLLLCVSKGAVTLSYDAVLWQTATPPPWVYFEVNRLEVVQFPRHTSLDNVKEGKKGKKLACQL